MRMLLIDENADDTIRLASALREAAMTGGIDAVANAKHAVAMFVQNRKQGTPYSFVCITHATPSIDALDMFRQLRLYEKNTPLANAGCMYCILATPADYRRQFSSMSGYDPHLEFLQKPVNPAQLASLIQGWKTHTARPPVVPSLANHRSISFCA